MVGFVPDYNMDAVILALSFYNLISNCRFLTDLMSHRTVVITIFYFFAESKASYVLRFKVLIHLIRRLVITSYSVVFPIFLGPLNPNLIARAISIRANSHIYFTFLAFLLQLP